MKNDVIRPRRRMMSKRTGREGNSFDRGERLWGRQVPHLTFISQSQMLSLTDEAHAKIKMMVMTRTKMMMMMMMLMVCGTPRRESG